MAKELTGLKVLCSTDTVVERMEVVELVVKARFVV